MEGNPIKYSDLVQADDSILNAIRQLDELSDSFTHLFNKTKEEAIKIKADRKSVV